MIIVKNLGRWFLAGALITASRAECQMVEPPGWIDYEKVLGVSNNQRHYDFDVTLIGANTATNVLWPMEKPEYSLQIVNNTSDSISLTAAIDIIPYGTLGVPNNIWLPKMFLAGNIITERCPVLVAANSYADIVIRPAIPERFGGYAMVLDLGSHGRRLVTSVVRTFRASNTYVQFPKQSLDDMGPDFLERIGVRSIRLGVDYTPTSFKDFQSKMDELELKLNAYQSKHITVLMMFGAGPALMPLGMPRPFLDSNGTMLNTKQDIVWLPELDSDFKKFVTQVCKRFGWPNGPVTAVSLWNEPWEGISISGWQSDMLRYREIYSKMAEGVVEARKSGIKVLVGGADSGSNAWDKLFADGKMTFLPMFDFCSIHYQGMESPAIYPQWINRQSPMGRVKIWDTESWVGNTDDRIGLVVGTNRSAGYDRSMGIFAGYLSTGGRGEEPCWQSVRSKEGIQTISCIPAAWSPAAALAAVQFLIGEREFKELLFKKGLPWIMVFEGENGQEDDGTIMVAGDIGEAFGMNNVLFRNVKSQTEINKKEQIHAQLALLALGDRKKDSLEKELAVFKPLADGWMKIVANASFHMFDFYGNTVAPKNGHYLVPLTYKGYFFRTDGSRGSFQRLRTAIAHSKVNGYEPLEITARDMTERIDQGTVLPLTLSNILNRRVKGSLSVTLGNMQLKFPQRIAFHPFETKTIEVKLIHAHESQDNRYALKVIFDAGNDGMASHYEEMHVNLISRLNVRVDGSLDEWKKALPQMVGIEGTSVVSVTEAAWYPFKHFSDSARGTATGYLAYDSAFFYFASKAADKTPSPGAYRFAERPDDDFFYPDTAIRMNPLFSLFSRENSSPADPANSSLLQLPSSSGRILHYLENTDRTNSFGLNIFLPDRTMADLSLYVPADEAGPVIIDVFDADHNVLLCSRTVQHVWNGAHEIFQIVGHVRIVMHSDGWWYTAKLAAVFIDHPHPSEQGICAKFLAEDLDTKGNWVNRYGTDGYFIVGLPPKLPAGWEIKTSFVEDKQTMIWPVGVRHFTYRKDPVLPDNSGLGFSFDNVQIAFNVVPLEDEELLANPPGTMQKYTGYKCTDYEFALNPVASRYGGGTEIWPLLRPGMNRKHFFPRQPKSENEGPVNDGKLVIRRDGNTLITECAIPWTQIPLVKKALDEGRKIKFSFRSNDDAYPSACMELARGRSVSKINARAFHPDWKIHWANELEFAFEK